MITKDYPFLWNRDTSGRLRFWFMRQEGDRYCSLYGLEGAQPTATGWTTTTAKNVGRSNETTPEDQATLEIEAEYVKKLDRGFSHDPLRAGQASFVKPMLAQKFEPKRLVDQPWIAIQPKLDGIRCIITADGARTRNGKPILTIKHIEDALRWAFEEDPELIVDGELYSHHLRDDFNTITSLVRKQKPTEGDLAEAARLIEYHVYDIPSCPDDYMGRYQDLKRIVVDSGLDKVPTIFVQAGDLVGAGMPIVDRYQYAIDEEHARFLAAGYEGTMIRLPAPYEFKRTHSLLKYKDFQDAEFEIREVQEGNGNWAGYAKRVELIDDQGRVFGAGIKGDQAQARQLLSDKDAYVGKKATVRYFALTPDGVPRFPVVVAFDPVDR